VKVVGITAEYNPLHNGHIYHISRAKELSGCDAAVVAMSGDFVQRGAPAVMDKWTRAEHALRCGADLVIEIPALHCLGNAGQYAAAGVRLLEAAGVSCISFGSETGDAEALISTAGFLKEHGSEIEDLISVYARRGLSYPAARVKAYEELGGSREGISILRNPNDTLAAEYIMSMEKAQPVPVKREGAGYNDTEGAGHRFMSATGIRDLMSIGGEGPESIAAAKTAEYVPACVLNDLPDAETIAEREKRLFDLVRYAVMTTPAELIDDCPSGGEGLGNLLRAEAGKADDLDDLILRTKSRRYTYTRISRLCMQVLLGIRRSEFPAADGPGYIRVLGFNETGRSLLSGIKKEQSAASHSETADNGGTLPVITNINKEKSLISGDAEKMLQLDVHAADIYNLITGGSVYDSSDHRQPVRIL
jgi:predicted nucleotidyltransferase